jgi:hypothetical protein
MIRGLLMVLTIALGATPFVDAEWKGPGWYQIAYDKEPESEAFWRHAGPFESEQACKASLPPENQTAWYECHNLQSQ